jgi:hypothetical protein
MTQVYLCEWLVSIELHPITLRTTSWKFVRPGHRLLRTRTQRSVVLKYCGT